MIDDKTQNDEADVVVCIARGQAAVTLASPCICPLPTTNLLFLFLLQILEEHQSPIPVSSPDFRRTPQKMF